jgi:hypothetical protein
MQDIPDLLEGLRQSTNILSALVGSIADEKMNRRRGDGFWTIAEHATLPRFSRCCWNAFSGL